MLLGRARWALVGWTLLWTAAARCEEPRKPDAAAAAASAERYTLRYRFLPGEEIRWEVVDEKTVEMTVGGSSRTAEMASRSTKVWRVKKIETDGSAIIENLVDNVDMRQKFSGQMEVRYNSRTDKTAPIHFETVAKSIGVPLSRVTVDVRGKLLKRERLTTVGPGTEGEIALPLPEPPVAVAETWTLPADLSVPLKNGVVKNLKTQQTFTLQSVENGIAVIQMATQILTPIDDPALQTQVMQRETQGKVRFDLKAGRIVSQEILIDKRIIGFSGAASVCQYKARFTEKLASNATPITDGPPVTKSAKKPDAVKPAGTPGEAVPTQAATNAKPTNAKPADVKPADVKPAQLESADVAAAASKPSEVASEEPTPAPQPIKTADARARASARARAGARAGALAPRPPKSDPQTPAPVLPKSSSDNAKPLKPESSAPAPEAPQPPATSFTPGKGAKAGTPTPAPPKLPTSAPEAVE